MDIQAIDRCGGVCDALGIGPYVNALVHAGALVFCCNVCGCVDLGHYHRQRDRTDRGDHHATLLQRVYFHTVDTLGTLVSLGIMIGALLLIHMRTEIGMTATLWIIGLVVITDIAGYFVGRIVGGPKFWPAFSPKKTWSGIVGGWIGAALFTYVMVQGGHLSCRWKRPCSLRCVSPLPLNLGISPKVRLSGPLVSKIAQPDPWTWRRYGSL